MNHLGIFLGIVIGAVFGSLVLGGHYLLILINIIWGFLTWYLIGYLIYNTIKKGV
jgi:hypothetical protein|tara:strand:+ start:403 stop:567 length:165 start_codon:yes stop_codon:yes gene_type:complete